MEKTNSEIILVDDRNLRTMQKTIPVCLYCQWKTKGEKTCLAFPLGIPDSIWMDGNTHQESIKGDNNIFFKLNYQYAHIQPETFPWLETSNR